MPKKICTLMLLAALMLSCLSGALSESYDVIFSSENPIPDIAERVRPAVVQVTSLCEYWNAATRLAS